MQVRLPADDAEPDPRPNTTSVTLTIPVDNLVLNSDGESVITTIRLRHRPVPEGVATAGDEWSEYDLNPGADAELELPPGEHDIEAHAYSAAGGPLAYGSDRLDTAGATDFRLELEPVLGSLSLSGPADTESAAAGSRLSL